MHPVSRGSWLYVGGNGGDIPDSANVSQGDQKSKDRGDKGRRFPKGKPGFGGKLGPKCEKDFLHVLIHFISIKKQDSQTRNEKTAK